MRVKSVIIAVAIMLTVNLFAGDFINIGEKAESR